MVRGNRLARDTGQRQHAGGHDAGTILAGEAEQTDGPTPPQVHHDRAVDAAVYRREFRRGEAVLLILVQSSRYVCSGLFRPRRSHAHARH